MGAMCNDVFYVKVFSACVFSEAGVVIGNAVASRWPLSASEVRALPFSHEAGVFSSKRSALWACIESPHGPIGVTCTHLNSIAHQGANRAAQMVEVLDLVKSRQRTEMINLRPSPIGMPAIVCGDVSTPAIPTAT